MLQSVFEELAVQAGATVVEKSGWTDYGTLDLDVEKFAELILMECCRAIRHDDSRFGGKFQGIILRHFGVEE